ncbi:hypothetical protein K5V21_11500 [Clostridium sardiniense]|uniref:Uncharacterized protein n=1 Tax=Clostridium sardiniense TaxID=29369 RepID=A0ABS7KZ25_CLOSR|nr:hypothetical protein [Clostridium sardiniense]MBY0756070.1 hypothetical protein [Clostridium sardiniense]MDQ0462118.1 hypothetical protein [Clostridium sardiniense]
MENLLSIENDGVRIRDKESNVLYKWNMIKAINFKGDKLKNITIIDITDNPIAIVPIIENDESQKLVCNTIESMIKK